MFSFDKSEITNIINEIDKSRILVIGDFAIDEMVYGQTSRISREAPVLILRHTHTNITLGAGSNAAHNISALTCGKVSAIGTYGNDYHGPILMNALKEAQASKEDEVFQIVGTIMLKKPNKEVIDSLNEKKELIELRLKSIDKQLKNNEEKAREIQESLAKKG